MKKILLMCCLFLGISAVSFAQGRARMNPEERAKELQTQLKLTDDQTAKITAIYKDQRTKIDSVRTANSGDRTAMRGAMMPLMTAANDKIKAVLTPEQVTEFEKLQKERMSRFGQGGGGPQK